MPDITEQPPPPPPPAAGAGAALAVPEIVATAGAPPPDKPSKLFPEYAPATVGVIVTTRPQLAPAASMTLLQLSVEVAIIVCRDSVTTPVRIAVEFGLLNEMLTVVD